MNELYLAIGCSVAALITVALLAMSVMRKPPGSDKMAAISRLVQQGARAFLNREYRYVALFVVVIFVLISVVGGVKPELGLSWKTAVAFMAGAVASGGAGFLGMHIATRANARTTAAAESGGVKSALDVALSGGGVMGMGVVGIALLGLVVVYKLFDGDPIIVNGYAMGASLVALFGRSEKHGHGDSQQDNDRSGRNDLYRGEGDGSRRIGPEVNSPPE